MTDRPIIFSAPTVRALLDGRKTQTRRIIKPQPGEMDRPIVMDDGSWHVTDSRGGNMSALDIRYRVGMRLWVREAWRPGAWRDGVIAVDYRASPEMVRTPWLPVPKAQWEHLWIAMTEEALGAEAAGRGSTRRNAAGDGWTWDRGDSPCRWRPSIHMPRWASRMTLTVTDVRVQRLQDISEEDAMAEGVESAGDRIAFVQLADALSYGTTRACYGLLWDHLHGPGAWDANRHVVALTFTVAQGNIDE